MLFSKSLLRKSPFDVQPVFFSESHDDSGNPLEVAKQLRQFLLQPSGYFSMILTNLF